MDENKRFGWARLTEAQNDEITRAKADFARAVSEIPPFKQIRGAALWIVEKIENLLAA